MFRVQCLRAVAAVIVLLAAAPVPAQGVVTPGVDYMSEVDYEGGKDLLDIYMPDGAEDVPVVVFFHGGGLYSGDRSYGYLVAYRLLPLGIGVVSPSYRLTPTVMHPAHVQDAAAATAWVIENIARFGGDPENVYVAGHSSGGYLAALLAVDPAYLGDHGLTPASVRGSIPISAFLYVEEIAADRPKDVWGTDPADWLAASVTPHISRAKGRMLLIYADGDSEWRRKQNDRFGAAVRAAGNNGVQVVEVPNRDHSSLLTSLNAKDDRIGDLIRRFIEEDR
jgi:acetyl esterase/lipase